LNRSRSPTLLPIPSLSPAPLPEAGRGGDDWRDPNVPPPFHGGRAVDDPVMT
jgi:hypothetical protein